MALAISSLGPRRGPMSIDELLEEAESLLVEYSPQIPLRFWLRSADAIQKQAQSYERDGNEEEAFKFYYRHALLVMNKLTSHPDLKLTENKAAWKKARADVTANLNKMEVLKPNIKQRYDQYQQMVEQRRIEKEKWQNEQRNNAYTALTGDMGSMSLSGRSSDGFDYGTQELDPTQDADLAVRLAHKEFRQNRESRVSRYPTEFHARLSGDRIQGTFFEDESDEDDLSKNMVRVGQRREDAFSRSPAKAVSRSSGGRSGQESRAPQYPSVPKQSNNNNGSSWFASSTDASPKDRSPRSSYRAGPVPLLPPSLPPKEFLDTSGPPIPQKLTTSSPPPGVVEAPDTSTAVLDPRNFTFKPTATTESGTPLRTVFINPKLRNRFLTIALANTERNLETCGILCGELLSNAFFISKLVIPEQESTSDTCDTVNEGALFDYCDAENLMTLGWIHTHPTQTCFMSSRDLHTHGGYQVQLAESIAIVCAPRREPSWGVFRLTDPPGLGAILGCKQTGIFHPHSEKNVYTDALAPGHVKEVENLPFDVVDLRPDSSWI
ncbi:hypothetical protein BT63DRAFT_430320 [Microthyrium microscopicum]|uniref:MPN domain-containing protein n=1 Tax=Microthyrium microscopicum TaxID=703497 RepID=A0A6A6TTU4_9PEZI|nr:hypothetical protein BT63DRAFT_430320 [Microthyrium microscopicum]